MYTRVIRNLQHPQLSVSDGFADVIQVCDVGVGSGGLSHECHQLIMTLVLKNGRLLKTVQLGDLYMTILKCLTF